MTIQEISEYLGLNEFTTYRLVKNGKIPAKKKENGKFDLLISPHFILQIGMIF